jgi:hypothetical protein
MTRFDVQLWISGHKAGEKKGAGDFIDALFMTTSISIQ